MLNCLCVGIGGFFGSVLRYLIGLIPVNPSNGFPVKTLVINVLGAFVLGLISAIAAKNSHMSEQLTLMLKVACAAALQHSQPLHTKPQALFKTALPDLALHMRFSV